MLGFVSNMLGPRANPIGIDFGTETLRLAQVSLSGGEVRLVAAASTDVPSHLRNDAQQRLAWLPGALRELLAAGGFRGRHAVLGLPGAMLSMVHLRVPQLDEATLRKAIPTEARGKLPYDPTHAVLRHVVAGEVYQGQEQKLEAIVMAAPKAGVEALLAATAKAKLDVAGINPEPLAILDCFGRFTRKVDQEQTVMYVDIGAAGSRAVVAHGGKVLFARGIGVGGNHFTQAVAQAAKLGFEDAKLMRLKQADLTPHGHGALADAMTAAPTPAVVDEAEAADENNSFALLGAGMAKSGAAVATPPPPAATVRTAVPEASKEAKLVDSAVREPLGRLVEELDLCRRYHEATFPSLHVDRLVFVGGEARQKGLCAVVARELGLAASVGDPLARMKGEEEFPAVESGLDRRVAQPGWAVALGLSLGPAGVVR